MTAPNRPIGVPCRKHGLASTHELAESRERFVAEAEGAMKP